MSYLHHWQFWISYFIALYNHDDFHIFFCKIKKFIEERTAQIIRPILRGKDIKRYSYEWADKWVIGTHNGYKIEGIDIPPIAIEDYPALKAYLDTFYPEISKRQDKGITPYNLRNCAYMNVCSDSILKILPKQYFCSSGDIFSTKTIMFEQLIALP